MNRTEEAPVTEDPAPETVSEGEAAPGETPATEAARVSGETEAGEAAGSGKAEAVGKTESGEGDETGAGRVSEQTEAGSGEAEPVGEAESGPGDETGAEAESEAEATVKVRPLWLRLPVILLAVAVVLAGAGAWFTLEARSAAGNPAAANLALTDVGTSAEVSSAVTLAVNRIFSYSYDRTDVTEKAAAAVLRGPAKDSYDRLFAQVRDKAPQQKLVLTSRVSAIAVQDLQNGRARLLVFLDQSAVRADNNATDSAAAQLSVTAERSGDGWVITDLEPR